MDTERPSSNDVLLFVQMDREQLKTKEYESLLLQCYQSFLKMLLSHAGSFQEGHRSPSSRRVCIKCLCGLAESLHHFNYGFGSHWLYIGPLDEWKIRCRTDLIKAVVHYMRHPDRTVTSICCSTLAEIVRSDVHGHRTLDVRNPCYVTLLHPCVPLTDRPVRGRFNKTSKVPCRSTSGRMFVSCVL